MALRIEDKKQIVAEVNQVALQSLAAVAAEYRGLTVSQMTSLRASAREKGVAIRVVRNTLAKRAFDGTQFECMQEALLGPLILAFSQADPGAAARLIRDFSKEHDKLKVTALALDGEMLEASALGQVADLPTREQAISMLMSVMQAAIAQFVRTVAAPVTQFVRTVDAVRVQKES